MESARIRSKAGDRYREPRIAWHNLVPFILLSSAGLFVCEYPSLYAESLPRIKELEGKAAYCLVFVYQALFYALAGGLSYHFKMFPRRKIIYEFLASGLLIFSGILTLLFPRSSQGLSALVWWAAWPLFQLRIWHAVAFSSSKRLMSYATGVLLMISFILTGGLLTLLEWMPGLSKSVFFSLMALLAGVLSLGTSRVHPDLFNSAAQERRSVSSAWLIVTGFMGLLAGTLWGYTEIFLPYVFKGNAGTALFTGISNLYPLILVALGVFAWPAGKILSYRDSDAGFVFNGVLSLLLVTIFRYAGEDTLTLSLAAAVYVPAFSLTCVATLSSAAKRIKMVGVWEGWKVSGAVWCALMLGRALIVFFQ